MIAEDGSVKTANISVVPALKEYRKKLKLISIILLIVGSIGVIVYLTLSAILDTVKGETPLWVDILGVFAVPDMLGLIGSIVLDRLERREKKENCTAEVSFYADCFFYRSKSASRPEERSESFFYPNAVLKRETEEYGYIFVSGTGDFLIFGKEGLEERELNTIRKLLKVPVPDGETVELKNYKTKEVNNDSEINS